MNSKYYLLTIVMLGLICTNAQAKSSMETVLDEAQIHSCRDLLIAAAADIIGKNEHRLYIDVNQKNRQNPAVSGIVSYHDRHAQIRFQAEEVGGICHVDVRESYVFSDPCTTIRTEVFKRWDLLGKLDDDTWVLQKAKRVRYPQIAYLSDAIRNQVACLVTVDSDITTADLAKAEKR